MSDDLEKSPLEAIQEKRAARKAAIQVQYNAQRAIDLAAIDALEEQYGDSNVAMLDVPFTPGSVTLIACKSPEKKYIDRYKTRCKGTKDGPGDPTAAADELAAVARVYPDPEAYAKLLEQRPGIHTQLGVAAVKLIQASAASEGKG